MFTSMARSSLYSRSTRKLGGIFTVIVLSSRVLMCNTYSVVMKDFI